MLRNMYAKMGFASAQKGTLLFSVHIFFRSIYRILNRLRGKETMTDKNGLSQNEINALESTKLNPSHYFPLKSKAKSSMRVVALCGIGDVLWSFVLIKALIAKYDKQKVTLVVHYNGDHRSGRSFELIKRFNFVDEVTPFAWPIHCDPPIDSDGYIAYTYSTGESSGGEKLTFDYKLVLNTFLEHGFDFEDICDHLHLDKSLIDYDVFKHYRIKKRDMRGVNAITKVTNGEYIVLYFGAKADNTYQGLNYNSLWKVSDWVALAKRIHETYKCKLIIVGAPYDSEYVMDFMKEFGEDFYEVFIDTVGRYDFENTLQILKHARFVIGFASGVTISSVYLGVKTAIFWRPQKLSMSPNHVKFGFHPHFATCWVPPKLLENNDYLDLWYTKDTPETIMNKLEEYKW